METKISIVGTGYVGLCTAVCFAYKGLNVVTATHQKSKADLVNSGRAPFYEPRLDELLKHAIKNDRLKAEVDLYKAVLETDLTFICSATPSRRDGRIDLQYIEDASKKVGDALRSKSGYHLVVVKSTVIPGTTGNLVRSTIEKHSGKRCGTAFGLCMNPEFLREGSAITDTLTPDYVVIGEYDARSGEVLHELYKRFYGAEEIPILRTNLSTAETIKYVNNAFLATKISFINTIANICEKVPGLDVSVVARAIGLDHRISPTFLKAGLGYGGSCFPKDVKALIAFSRELNYDPVLLKTVDNVNNTQPYKAIELAKKYLPCLKSKKIAVLGLAFKPNTDDIREAVSIKVIERLLQEEARVTVYDPRAISSTQGIFQGRIQYASSSRECIKNADCCILVTEWDEFRTLRPEDFAELMDNPIVIDGRRIYDPKLMEGKLKYAAVGLGEKAS